MSGNAPTLDEILQELEAAAATKRIAGAKSTPEWAAEWGVCESRTRKIIKHAINTNRMTAYTDTRPSVLRPGCVYTTPVYAFKVQP